MKTPKIVIHTDVFLEHLYGPQRMEQPSVLRRTMGLFFCYTTVFQAIELFSIATTDRERQVVEDSMSAMKLLGLNPKNARTYGELLSAKKKSSVMDLLVAGLCIESRLPLLTDRKQAFKGIKGLTVVPMKRVLTYDSASAILQTT